MRMSTGKVHGQILPERDKKITKDKVRNKVCLQEQGEVYIRCVI